MNPVSSGNSKFEFSAQILNQSSNRPIAPLDKSKQMQRLLWFNHFTNTTDYDKFIICLITDILLCITTPHIRMMNLLCYKESSTEYKRDTGMDGSKDIMFGQDAKGFSPETMSNIEGMSFLYERNISFVPTETETIFYYAGVTNE